MIWREKFRGAVFIFLTKSIFMDNGRTSQWKNRNCACFFKIDGRLLSNIMSIWSGKNTLTSLVSYSLFRNKRFMLDEMTWRNASKFAIFHIYENPKLLFPFFISCYFIFSPNECPGLYWHRPGHYSLGKK